MSCLGIAQRRSARRGQALVELALFFTFLMVLLVGLFEFSFLLYAHVQVSNAAREGARAGSLYRSTRYATFSDIQGSGPPACDGTYAGWSLQQTVEEAIVTHPLITSGSSAGCPDTGSAPTSTSLGLLDPAPSPMWTVSITPTQATYCDSATNPSCMPRPGTRAAVTLDYPYHPPIISNILPFITDPIWIRKSVEYEYHP
ncbi:MAG: hypothetical protein KatS3mg057_0669 [Herpetosiphonaceae bacterium]|nr:MAG: hypothetical protein KatS3mg057_0669 [Herpetosiphonaceae bacterium]